MRALLIAAAITAMPAVCATQPGAGANYGARDPEACKSRREPAKGAPTAEQARHYFACDAEREVAGAVPRASRLYLVSDVVLEVAPASRPFNIRTDTQTDIDPRQAVYNIRGSYKEYQCLQPESNGAGTNPKGRNCNRWDNANASGFCYISTFGDWHCAMTDRDKRKTGTGLPPPGAR